MDRRAKTADGRANAAASAGRANMAHFSTALIEPTQRAAAFADEIGSKLTASEALLLHGADGAGLRFDWSHADLGGGVNLGRGRLAGVLARRGPLQLRDGDDGVTLFIPGRRPVRFEQNDRRATLSGGAAFLASHARPVSTWWPDGDFSLVRLPRAAFGAQARVEALGGTTIDGRAAAMPLLRAYLDVVWRQAAAGEPLPALAARHLGELVQAAVTGPTGAAAAGGIAGGRLALLLEALARRHAEPGLTMAAVATATGISARAGYLAFAAAGIDFTELLTATRLDRARELLAAPGGRIGEVALAAGFADLSHFNRRFRERFGMTPSEARQAGE